MDYFNLLCPCRHQEQQETLNMPLLASDAFTALANDRGMLDKASLARFLSEHQKDGVPSTNSDSKAVVEHIRSGIRKSASHGGHGTFKQAVYRRSSMSAFVHKNLTMRSAKPEGDGIKKEEFLALLLDPRFSPAVEAKVTQDMTAPLSHYFIYTGHNSYLKGNQLTSQSSVAPIIKSLEVGVRVIELDLWPNDKKTDILVMHGGTLTKPVPFRECMEAIKEHAFVTSPYPVIVTLEAHLPNSLQAKAAKIVAEILGSLLWIPPPDTPMTVFPSPEELMGRILISTQPPKMDKRKEDKDQKKSISKKVAEAAQEMEASGGNGPARTASVDSDAASPPRTQSLSAQDADLAVAIHGQGKSADVGWEDEPVQSNRFQGAESSDDEQLAKMTVEDDPRMQASCPPGGPSPVEPIAALDETPEDRETVFKKLVEEYRSMISIAGGRVKGETVKASLMDGPTVKRVSVSESQLVKVAASHPDDLVRFTQNNILRVYPTGTRIDSSNYDPIPGWLHGAQLVALNMQGYGRPLWLVHGFFLGNGRAGYIKKPGCLLEKKAQPDQQASVGGQACMYWNPQFPGPTKKVLKVRLLLGTGWLETFGKTYFDAFSPPDFYVKIGVSGVPADTGVKKLAVQQDKWNPSWEDQLLEFPLAMPQLALLRIEVLEYDQAKADEFAGQAVLPVGFLKEGFRCVPLFDKKGYLLGKADKTKLPNAPGKGHHEKNSQRLKELEDPTIEFTRPRLLFHFELADPN